MVVVFLIFAVVDKVDVTVVLLVAVVIGALVVETTGSRSIWTSTYTSQPSPRRRPRRSRMRNGK